MSLPETHMNADALSGDVPKAPRIRAIAICIVRKGNSILVAERVDPLKEETNYRPLGGGIEFGERGCDAVVREFREEAGLELTNLSYVAMLESIFMYNGQMGHEIVLVYSGDLADRAAYELPSLAAYEDDGMPFTAPWKDLDEFGPSAPLYPDGLLELLRQG